MPSDSISVKRSFVEGFHNLAGPSGVVSWGLLFLFGLANLPVSQTISARVSEFLLQAFLPEGSTTEAQQSIQEGIPFALDVPLWAAVLASIVLILAFPVLEAMIVRLYASESDEPIPFEDLFENLGSMVLKAVALGGLVGLLSSIPIPFVGQGLGLLLIFLFVFLIPAVALEDLGFLASVKRNFAVMRASLAEVVAVTALVFGLGVVLSVIVGSLSFAAPFVLGQPPELLGRHVAFFLGPLGAFLVAVTRTIWLAVITSAYKQAREIADRDPDDFSDLEDDDWSSAGDDATGGRRTSSWGDGDNGPAGERGADGETTANDDGSSDADVGMDDDYDPFADDH